MVHVEDLDSFKSRIVRLRRKLFSKNIGDILDKIIILDWLEAPTFIKKLLIMEHLAQC